MATRRRSLTLAAAAVSVLGAAAAVAGARPAVVRPELIAFTRADGLYTMRADGSGVRRIMGAGPEALYGGGAAWSPDGRRLAFAAWNGIWLLDANGRHRMRLAAGEPPYWIGVKPHRKLFSPRPTNFGSPTWSPDGRRIAFTAFQGAENRDVWIMDADGSDLHRLVKTPLFEGEVDWSPVGGRLVFDSGSWVSDVYVARPDGGGLRNLTPGGGWVGSGQPAWSPDARRIAFGRPSGLWVMDADGGSPAQLTSRKGADGFPDWSPDGRRIAFVRKLDPKQERSAEIYVVNADGSGLTRLTRNRIGEGSPAWQPVAAP